ncbi:MAG: 4-alpha-glucanotransferase [Anaerolineales bacterium]
MLFNHTSGILLHISSLLGSFGIGDLGPDAYRWLDFLKAARVAWWQVLPVGPTGYGDSPYQSYSSFAGNPNLVSPQLIYEDGLIDIEHLERRPDFPSGRVDYSKVIEWKRGLFQVAYMRLKDVPQLHEEFEQFRSQQKAWLDDYSSFMTIKALEGEQPWIKWPASLRDRGPEAILEVRRHQTVTIGYHAFQQYLFFRQWSRLRARMQELGIGLIGDLPIYVAEDSADVWCARHLFELDQQGRPIRIAGVPPDMFSATGQRWGNPLYRWDVHRQQNFAWWLTRLRGVLGMVDVLRLDHFRGFGNYYAVPASEPTAKNGVWELGPGEDFFKTVNTKLGGLPLIAEDLGGEGEPLVINLRDKFGLPGMKLFQFAFDEDMHHKFLPHNYPENCVAYTGTHDNDTTTGWFAGAPETERKLCLEYLNSDGRHIAWDMLRRLWASPADLTVGPLQDFLELGTEARMNYPGTPTGNWTWRVTSDQLTDELGVKIRELNLAASRAT